MIPVSKKKDDKKRWKGNPTDLEYLLPRILLPVAGDTGKEKC